MTVQQSWPHFNQAELTCHCGCARMGMDPDFMRLLEDLRTQFGKPMRVTSAYRCPAHNSKASHTSTSGPHTTGKAVDLQISGHEAFRLLGLAIQLGFTGLGISQQGPHQSRFIHLDTLSNNPNSPRPWVWSY